MSKNIKTNNSIVTQDANGNLTSYAYNTVYSVDAETASIFEDAGMAEESKEVVPEGTMNIVANGEYDVTLYAGANVNVEGITPTGTKTITENGTYDVTDFASADVNVEGGGITPTGTKTITENGTYDVTEFASAEVNVSGGGTTPTGTKTITENGTYDVTDFASAVVNVSLYTVSYDANGGTGFAQNQSVIAGEAIQTLDDGSNLIAPSALHTFVGWATTANASVPDVSAPYTPIANTVLYAVWTAPETYTVTFDRNLDGVLYGRYNVEWKSSSTAPHEVTVQAGDTISLLVENVDFTVNVGGYSFEGWSTTKQTSASVVPAVVTDPYEPFGDTTLYAILRSNS